MNELEPRGGLSKRGLKGAGAVVGGAGLLVLNALVSLPVLGWIIGGAVTLIGFAIGSSKSDRMAGAVVAGAGILTLLARILPGIRWMVWAPGIVLLAAGGLSLYRFFTQMRKRM